MKSFLLFILIFCSASAQARFYKIGFQGHLIYKESNQQTPINMLLYLRRSKGNYYEYEGRVKITTTEGSKTVPVRFIMDLENEVTHAEFKIDNYEYRINGRHYNRVAGTLIHLPFEEKQVDTNNVRTGLIRAVTY